MWDLVKKWGVFLAVFLLPFQTRYIWGAAEVGGHTSEFAVYSVYAVQILILILGLAFLFESWKKINAQDLKSTEVIWSIGLLVYLLLSWVFGLREIYGLVHIGFVVSALILLIVLIQPNISRRDLTLVFVAGLLIPIAFGIYQFFLGSFPASTILGIAVREAQNAGDSVFFLDNGVRMLRAYGTFSHPNIFAGYLVIGILSLITFLRRMSKDRLTFVLIGLMFIGLVLTGSSAALLALIIALVIGMFAPLHNWRGLGGSAVVVIILFIFTPVILQWLGFDSTSIIERTQFLSYAPEVIAKHWLFGVGAGQYIFALADVVNLDWWMYQPVHNVFVLVLDEIGLIGFIGLIGLMGLIYKKGAAPNMITLWAALLVLASFDHYLWSSWSGLALVAFVMALSLKIEDEKIRSL